MIFSEDRETYIKNIKLIRKEFYLYDNKQWYNGRLAFLKKLTTKKQIYYFSYFNKILEQKAKDNINYKINYLKNLLNLN